MKRIKDDKYYSPKKLIEAYLDLGEDKRPIIEGTVLEPCNGGGDISSVLMRNASLDVFTSDLDMGNEYDATKAEYWDMVGKYSWIFTNPPFNVAPLIVRHSINNARQGVIMLLRASFLEPCHNRRDILGQGLSHVTMVNPRPRFRGDSKNSDSSTVAFFVWQKGYTSNVNINHLVDWNQ
jgi:hypothetical protein